MVNWKNLRQNPLTENCNICLKIGSNYETYYFRLYPSHTWELYKYPRFISPEKVPEEAQYINLDEIK